MTQDVISSARLDLISLPPSFLEASLTDNLEATSQWLGMPVPSDWLENRWVIEYRLEQLRTDPTIQPWLLRAVVLREEHVMVGHIGFHTAPNPDYLQEYAPGAVEIGYTIYPKFRRRGYATEACAAMMTWAREQQPVVPFVVTISPNNIASLNMANNFGFQKVGSHIDEIDGIEDIFVLTKPL